MIEHELMDLENKPNKANTGYMTSCPITRRRLFSAASTTPYLIWKCFRTTRSRFRGLPRNETSAHHRLCGRKHGYCGDTLDVHGAVLLSFTPKDFFGDKAGQVPFPAFAGGAHVRSVRRRRGRISAYYLRKNPNLTPKERTYEWHKLEEKIYAVAQIYGRPVYGARRILVS